MTTFDAIIFDMDGLLVDSERVWHMAEDQFIQSYGHVYTDDVRESIVGLRLDEFIARLKVHYSLRPSVAELAAELEALVLDLIPREVQAQPGAQALVDWVIAHQLPHAIASSSSMNVINQTLGSQGWDSLFAIRCSADDDQNGKPAPDVYLRAAARLQVEPTRCLALEDSPTGARAAMAAGMTTYAVPDRSHTDSAAFETITPHVFDDLHQVLEVLRG
jgi:HAD superfamily hydrolase (TIGR01509 family)